MIPLRDEFLSEEDLDLRTMTEAELLAYWDLWLHQAQASNDKDQDTYSHGVFTAPGREPGNMASRTAPLNATNDPKAADTLRIG